MAAFDEYGILRCSITTVPLIVGGESALPKEFPHMVIFKFFSYTRFISRMRQISHFI